MQQSETLLIRIIVIILCMLSMAGSSLIIWTIYKTPRMSKNPGSIILRISIAQLIITFQLFFAQFYTQNEITNNSSSCFNMPNGFCQAIAFIEIISSSEYIFYNLFFAINLYISLLEEQYDFTKLFLWIEIVFIIISIFITVIFFCYTTFGINIAGVCGLQDKKFITLSILLFLATIFLIILVILIIREKSQFKVTMYQKNQEKFNQKYYSQFKLINLLYLIVFMITYLLPTCLMFLSSLTNTIKEYKYFLPIINPLGGIFLFIIRINDPLVKKYILIQIKGEEHKQKKKLKEKLISKESLINLDQGLEISSCNPNKLRYTVKATDKSQSYEFSLRTAFGSNFTSKAIKSNQDLFIILLSIKNAINQCVQLNSKSNFQFKQLKPYYFTEITQSKLYLQDDQKEMELKYRSQNNFTLKDYVNETCYKRVINCFSYANKTLIYQFSEFFNLDFQQFKLSLSIQENTFNIIHTKLSNTYGPIFITHDHYFTLELISKQQKKFLTKGGGLMNICNRYYQEYNKITKNGNTFLPAIFGLYTIQLDEEKFVNVILKLNQLKVQFPISKLQWDDPNQQDLLIQQNIFGWKSVSIQQGVQQLLVVDKIIDGKYELNIEDIDFKLSKNSQKELLQLLAKDLESFCFTKNITLSFVYFKFPTNKLNSMCNHENSLSFHYQTIKNTCQMTPLKKNENFQELGQFELDSKLGYARIFFDDLWPNEWEYIIEDERNILFQKLIQQITDII